MNEILADHADKNKRFFGNSGENVPCSNILKISSVFPQQDGPQTAMNNLSDVEIILFITWDSEERTQLCRRVKKTKMLILRNQV